MFEDAKEVIIVRKSKKDKNQDNGKKGKRQTMIYKKLHRKLKIEQYELY